MKSILTALLLALALSAAAQPSFKLYPDSIRVEMPEQGGVVVFELKEFIQSEAYIRGFSATLGDVLGQVRQSLGENLQTMKPQRIEVQIGPEGTKEVGVSVKPYGEKKLMTIQAQDPEVTRVTILSNRGIVELLPPGWEILLTSKSYRVKVYAADFVSLESISKQDFAMVADAVRKDVDQNHLGRKSIEAQISMKQNAVASQSIAYIHPGDQIFMTFQAGVGLYQNIIYPELSFKMGLSFRDHMRRPHFRTSLVASRLFFAERTTEGFNAYPNSFLSGIFEMNFDRKSGKASWSGIGLGFLVNRSGNYFQGNTGKFFITHTVTGSRFSMVPEFYLTDDFKKFTFGMTLKYSF